MSDIDPKEFRYFKFNEQKSAELVQEYRLIREQRHEIIKSFLDSIGASGYQLHEGKLWAIRWPKDFDFKDKSIIKSVDGDYVKAKGNGRSKSGKAFNEKIETGRNEVNKKLNGLPTMGEFLLARLGWEHRLFDIGRYLCGVSWYVRKGAILCQVPNSCFTAHHTENGFSIEDGDAYAIPAYLEEITYGQFYDLTQKSI